LDEVWPAAADRARISGKSVPEFPEPTTANSPRSLNRPTALCGPVRLRFDSGPEDRLLRSDDTVKIRSN
jgi:hypothetical protein